MKLCFDSIVEIREFVAALKGTRGKKDEGDDAATPGTGGAPAPLAPPKEQPGANFQTPPAQPSFTPPAGFPGVGGAQPDPTQAIVQRIVTRIDGAVASGQPADAVLTWFRSQCGAEAANATMDQIKANFLPKLAMPALENIAKLMNA